MANTKKSKDMPSNKAVHNAAKTLGKKGGKESAKKRKAKATGKKYVKTKTMHEPTKSEVKKKPTLGERWRKFLNS
jgi:hypothetical protein